MKAYRKLAQQWHPDNFSDDADKKKAETKFIDIAAAKEVLTDPGLCLFVLFWLPCPIVAIVSFAACREATTIRQWRGSTRP